MMVMIQSMWSLIEKVLKLGKQLDKKQFLLGGCISVISFFIQACGTGDISREFTKIEAVRLLTSDSSKQWIRVSRTENGNTLEFSECEESYSLHFIVSSTDSIIYRIDDLPICDTQKTEPDTLFNANWSLSQNISLISTDTLNLSDLESTPISPIGISILTPRRLNIQFLDEDSNLVTEAYIY